MARFQINDTIELVKFNSEVIRKGVITKGPYYIEKVDHYMVQWNDETREQIMCDITTSKYHYRYAN